MPAATRPPSGSLFSRIASSIASGSARATPSEKQVKYLPGTLVLHFRPRFVPEAAGRFTHTWGLGGAAFMLVLLLFGTGLLLKMAYHPFPGTAYDSILTIRHDIPFGLWVRNIHHWSANMLVVILFLHMQRVFFTGGYHFPRQFNWVVGVVLFLLVLASNFTGYLLPWDQLAYWAVTISTGMLDYVPLVGGWIQTVVRGGPEIGPATLLRFFALHTAVLPAGILFLALFHFWRVRKAGGVVVPQAMEDDGQARRRTPVFPDLLIKELTVALVVVAFVLIVAILFEAPLGEKANPGLSPNPAKAPWFFIGLQEMLLHLHPVFAVVIIPTLMLAGLLALPYLNADRGGAGVWFYSEKGLRMGLVTAVSAFGLVTAGILGDAFLFNFTSALPALPAVVGSGLLPVALFTVMVIVVIASLQRRYSADRNEVIQSLYIFFVITYVVLTVVCLWFRGMNMDLTWPLW